MSGEGTGELSLKKHGPHVDCKNCEISSVLISFFIPGLGKDATIFRRVSDAENPVVTPDEPEIHSIVAQIESRPEFCLSRRQLIKFILATPVNRSQYVQALLQLDEIDSLRLSLNKIANSSKKDADQLLRQKQDIERRLMQHLDGLPLSAKNILMSVNKRRSSLCLPEIKSLEATTNINDGLVPKSPSLPRNVIIKNTAESELSETIGKLNSIGLAATEETISNIFQLIGSLLANEEDLKRLQVEDFLQTSVELFDGNSCPVCDSPFTTEKFLSIVLPKIEYYKYLTKNKVLLENYFDEFRKMVVSILDSIAPVVKYGRMLTPSVDVSKLEQLQNEGNILKLNLKHLFPMEKRKEEIENFMALCKDSIANIKLLQASISLLPNPSEQEAARDFLIIGQTHLDSYRDVSRKFKAANDKKEIANNISNEYNEWITKSLDKIYNNIENDFVTFYKYINQDDESCFDANLTPKKGKLDLAVDFYGRGYYPPSALHSEGHQDSMGLCLYLSLMKYLFSNDFTLAVLDDVLMSVDTGHRRQFSKLLKEFFPSTQFIITTHDKTWFNHLRNDGLIPSKGFVDFRSWSVDVGPAVWQGCDVWRKIDVLIDENNIQYASEILRRYLEHVFEDICHRLHASVPYRSDARYTLGDFLPNGYSALKNLLKKGKNAANSFGNTLEVELLSKWDEKLCHMYQIVHIDDWQLNSAVHYNNWENFHKNDFLPLVDAYKKLIDCFKCDKCNSFVCLTNIDGVACSVDCPCGNVSIKLIGKKQ